MSFSTEHAPATVGLPAGTLQAMHRALAQNRSPEESAALLRELGFESGTAFLDAFSGWLRGRGAAEAPESLPAERFWALLAEFFSSLGWGTLRLETPRPGVVSLSSPEWAESEGASRARQPTCHLTTGLLADLLGRVAGTDLAVMEVECRSRGDRECRFLLGGVQALERVHERLRGGAPYAEALEALG